ncbi:MAG TPA: hypothetical protein VGD64_04115 [Acidisarcina sp.]
MPLNLLLFQSGCLTHRQSIEAAGQLKIAGGNLKGILLRLGYVTEEQITRAYALQAGYPVYTLTGESTDKHALFLSLSRVSGTGTPGAFSPQKLTPVMFIPRMFIDRYSMVPVHYIPATRRLLMGFVEKVDHGVLYAVEHMTDCIAEPCFITPADFERLRDSHGTGPIDDQLECNEDARPADMARVISACAVQMCADEARLRKTRDYLWAKLLSQGREVDLLFPRPWSGMAGAEAAEGPEVQQRAPAGWSGRLQVKAFTRGGS